MRIITYIKKTGYVWNRIIFALLVIFIFTKVTYLYRDDGSNRDRVLGLKEQEKLDVVCVGGSVLFVSWSPLKAYDEYGFTSYNLATDSLQGESIKTYLEYARLYRQHSLFVIDATPFVFNKEDVEDVGIRNSTDSFDLWLPIRYELLFDYLKNRDIDAGTDVASFFFDIALYHNNVSNLESETAWGYLDNKAKTTFTRGFRPIVKWSLLSEPEDFRNDERADINDKAKSTLIELLEYCKNNELDVLFVVTPYYISYDNYSRFNSIKDDVNSYGYSFLNLNDYYEDMMLDFKTDFYNEGHMNPIGADKFTSYMSKYLKSHYSLKDHRGEKGFEDWDSDSVAYKDEFAKLRNETFDLMAY